MNTTMNCGGLARLICSLTLIGITSECASSESPHVNDARLELTLFAEDPDDSFVDGYGDGGSVIRCRPDGTQISEFATGFWNPFDLKFDRSGRLLLVDNDPDARGPNRLLQVVRGGDYGYKSLFGGAGTHPFQGWDGRLPGTLPYIAGTGEAPCGLIDCRRSSLPDDYQSSMLATIWNENTIERFDLDPDTGQLRGKSVFLKGGQDCRPVAVDCDSYGNLFFTDWVLFDYPNHGRGRIWRIAAQPDAKRIKPQKYFAEYRSNDLLKRIQDLSEPGPLSHGATGRKPERATPNDGDFGSETNPLIRHAAIMRLAADESLSSSVRRLAINRFDDATCRQQTPMLRRLLRGSDDELAIAAMESFARMADGGEQRQELLSIATNRSRSKRVRLHALAELGNGEPLEPATVASLENDPSEMVSIQANRVMTAWASETATSISDTERPNSKQQWQEILSVGGDPDLGRHVFFSSRVGYAKCIAWMVEAELWGRDWRGSQPQSPATRSSAQSWNHRLTSRHNTGPGWCSRPTAESTADCSSTIRRAARSR